MRTGTSLLLIFTLPLFFTPFSIVAGGQTGTLRYERHRFIIPGQVGYIYMWLPPDANLTDISIDWDYCSNMDPPPTATLSSFKIHGIFISDATSSPRFP